MNSIGLGYEIDRLRTLSELHFMSDNVGCKSAIACGYNGNPYTTLEVELIN